MDELVDQLFPALESMLDLPLFFFGHSLGALLAFCCARALRRRALRLPEHLFVSGRTAPHKPNPDRGALSMSRPEFMALIRRRGGTPPEVLAEPELMDRLIPMIRADFALIDSYKHASEAPLDSTITVFGGTRDELARRPDLEDWSVHTSRALEVEVFEGDHFFINSNRACVIQRVVQTIESALGRGLH
jgi:medium-chain acyl-[acyl-carrier-protein] hydrolase